MATLALYRGLTAIAAPFVDFYLSRRLARGKEDPSRLTERRGVASRERPDGPLIWLHAASVGEAQSALALIRRILDSHAGLHVLVTTGTVTSAQLLADRLPPRSFHQFVPVDRLSWVRRFLDYWRPDLSLWMESDLWPNLLSETVNRGLPAVLVNGRMSSRSYNRWRRVSGFDRRLIRGFSLCLAQTEEQAERLRALGADQVKCVGNLKFSAAPLPGDEDDLRVLRDAIGDRPIWLAASTHPGEEAMVADVHDRLAARYPNLLTLIVPRHPSRGADVARILSAGGLKPCRRELGELPASDCDIYLADTLGELGLFYRLADIAFIGGSTANHGGHNPLEAAQLRCAVVHGPDMANFQSIADELHAAGGIVQIDGAADLADAVARLMDDGGAREAQISAAAAVAEANRSVVDRVHGELAPFLDAIGQGSGGEGA